MRKEGARVAKAWILVLPVPVVLAKRAGYVESSFEVVGPRVFCKSAGVAAAKNWVFSVW